MNNPVYVVRNACVHCVVSGSQLQFIAVLHEIPILLLNNTIVQHNKSTFSDVRQVQPGHSGNTAVSEPCTSNASCMNENVEIGRSQAKNGNVLNGNICSMASINVSMPTTGGQVLPELSFPTFTTLE